MPIIMPMASISPDSGQAMLIADKPVAPMAWPIKMPSTTMYRPLIIKAAMAGML